MAIRAIDPTIIIDYVRRIRTAPREQPKMKLANNHSEIKMHHLSYFIQAASSGSLVSAAEVLNVSQPAVSKAISDLEAILGVSLFRRRPTGMELTGYGEEFLRHTVAAKAKIAEAVSSVEEMKDTKRGHVRVGVVPMDALPFFHQGVMGLKARRPNIVVSIITGSNERLLPDLKIGGLDLVIGRAADSAMMSELTHEPLFEERMAFVVWPSNALSGRKTIHLAELNETPWLVPMPNSSIRERLQEECTKQNVNFPINFVEGGVAMVLATLADCPEPVVVWPYSLVEERIQSGQLIELDVPINKQIAPTGITRREADQLSQSAAIFLEELRHAGFEHRSKPRDISTGTESSSKIAI